MKRPGAPLRFGLALGALFARSRYTTTIDLAVVILLTVLLCSAPRL